MLIPLNDSKMFYKFNKSEIDISVRDLLDNGNFILGENVEKFEEEFSKYCGSTNCIGVGNGTDALEISLLALGVGKGDYVACTANAGFYSSSAIISVGAIPYYIDVTLDRMTMDCESLKSAISKKTKAVIVTHLYGQMAQIKEIVEIAKKNEIPVIEDCAQAHGASIEGKKAGTWGDIGCFSFYPTKNLGALGDAGAILSSDEILIGKIRRLRQYGWGKKYFVDNQVGKNSRMDEIQAAVLRIKLKSLDFLNKRRLSIAKNYSKELTQLNIIVPKNFGTDYVAHLYTIRVENRLEIREKLTKNGIEYGIYYPISDDQQCYVQKRIMKTKLNNTYSCCKSVITIPCSPFLSENHQMKIISALKL